MNFPKEILKTNPDSSEGLLNRAGKVKREKPNANKIADKVSNAFGICNKLFYNLAVVVSFPTRDTYWK